MSDDRKRILGLLAEGRITADEAERLIAAMERPPAFPAAPEPPVRKAKYLRVEVDDEGRHGGGPAKVNVRVPMALLRAGVRLGSLLPAQARDQINAAIAEHGVAVDINQLKPDDLEALVEQLGDFAVDVGSEGSRVRVYCE
jgi:hypothetical protein